MKILGLEYDTYVHFYSGLIIALVSFNYVMKAVEAPIPYASTPGFPPALVADGITSNVNTIVNTVEDRLLLQLTWVI